jgi:ribosome-binding factor A
MADKSKSNDSIQEVLALIVARELELPDALVTVTYATWDSGWQRAKIYFSVLPAGLAGTALRQLKRQSATIAKSLQKRLKLRQAPHLQWEFDPTEKRAGELEDYMKNIDNEDKD